MKALLLKLITDNWPAVAGALSLFISGVIVNTINAFLSSPDPKAKWVVKALHFLVDRTSLTTNADAPGTLKLFGVASSSPKRLEKFGWEKEPASDPSLDEETDPGKKNPPPTPAGGQ